MNPTHVLLVGLAVLAGLGVPALFAGSVIARLFSVTELLHDSTHSRANRR